MGARIWQPDYTGRFLSSGIHGPKTVGPGSGLGKFSNKGLEISDRFGLVGPRNWRFNPCYHVTLPYGLVVRQQVEQ